MFCFGPYMVGPARVMCRVRPRFLVRFGICDVEIVNSDS